MFLDIADIVKQVLSEWWLTISNKRFLKNIESTWVKVFRIIPEFRILRLTFCGEADFPQKVSLKMLN